MESLKDWYESIKNLSYAELIEYRKNLIDDDGIEQHEKYLKAALIYYREEKLSLSVKYYQLAYDAYTLNKMLSNSEKEKWSDIFKSVYYEWFLVEILEGAGAGCSEVCALCCCLGGVVGCTGCCFGGNAQAFCDWSESIGNSCCCLNKGSCWDKCCGFHICS